MKEFKNSNFDLTKFELYPGKIVNNDVYNICEKQTLYEKKKKKNSQCYLKNKNI